MRPDIGKARESTTQVLSEYRELIARFEGGEMSAQEFADLFADQFSQEARNHDERLYNILNEVFWITEGFEEDPALLHDLNQVTPGFNYGLDELRRVVAATIPKLLDFEAILQNGDYQFEGPWLE